MTLSEEFVGKLESLKSAERACLRQLSGQRLDESVAGFDVFTGLWWPLRQKSPRAPERRSAWLVAKLYGAYPLPNVRAGPYSAHVLPCMLGRAEPRRPEDADRHRRRFDALLCVSLREIEPHLVWALRVVNNERSPTLDWVELLEDLRRWDRPMRDCDAEDDVLRAGRRSTENVREKWARSCFDVIDERKRPCR